MGKIFLNNILNNKKLISYISLIIVFFSVSVITFAQDTEYSQDEIKEYFKAGYSLEKYDDALNIIKNLDENSYDEEIYLLLGNIANSKGDEENAILNYTKAIQKNPKYYKAYYNLGNCYFAVKNYDSAIEYYKKSLKYNRDYAPALYNIGCAYLEKKEYSKAKFNFIKAVNINPENEKYYYNLAYSYKLLGKEKTANKILGTYKNINKNQ